MIDFLLQLDNDIILAVNGLNHIFLDPFVRAFSGKAIWIPFYLAIASLIIWKFGWKRGLILIAAVGLAVGLSDLFTAKLIRPFFQRLRPSNLENPISAFIHLVDGYRSGSYGFPSCHAANSFALAVSTSLIFRSKEYTIFIFIWAALQCYSRMYLGVHYLGDLLAGATVGSAFGYLCFWATKKLDLSFNPKASAWPVIIVGIATMVAIELIILSR